MCTWASPPEWFEAVGAGDELKLPDVDEVNRAGGMKSVPERLADLERIAPIFAKFSVEDWVRIAAESGKVTCQAVRTPEEALCDPALVSSSSHWRLRQRRRCRRIPDDVAGGWPAAAQ